ncbi:MAG TPA: M20/M25/M40 family metallo-hydrolase [Gemmatimonadales bacterium]|nr:M20/M25/M40 family metallo-hydrolase [Gemmatimonadales bacterium]
MPPAPRRLSTWHIPALLVSTLLGSAAASPAAAQTADLQPHQRLAREIYRELVEINTVDSVGSVTKAAEAMAARFRAAGFPDSDVRVLIPPGKPTKGNLVVRYRGRGTRKPVLLLAHLDVVAALRSDWTVEPFVLGERDGYFYGRGTSDDKAMAAIFVADLIRGKQAGWVPDRDLILALTADEEGGDANGVEWLIAEHRDLIDAAYAINEGGGGTLRDGRPFYNSVQAAEKVPVNFTLTVTNRGGHSSVPRPDNAIFQLAAGLERVSRYQFPVELNEVSRAFFERTAALEEPAIAAAMRAIVKNPRDAKAAQALAKVPRYNAMLRTTCTATRLAGGHAYNALPQLATANINCRIVPTSTPAAVRAALVEVVGDTAIKISETVPIREKSGAAPSALTPELMQPITEITHAMFGAEVPVIPVMSTGATDGRFLRAAGIPTYGVSGIFGDPSDARAHGRDERLLVRSFYDGQEFLHRLVARLAGGAPTVP